MLKFLPILTTHDASWCSTFQIICDSCKFMIIKVIINTAAEIVAVPRDGNIFKVSSGKDVR